MPEKFYDPVTLYEGIILVNPDTGRDPGHPQVSRYLQIARDLQDVAVAGHDRGTNNHKDQEDMGAMARWRLGMDTDPARILQVRDKLIRERNNGKGGGEVESTTYRERSAGSREVLWAETRQARIDGAPEPKLLAEIEALALDWIRGHRWMLRTFRLRNGLVTPPAGIRCKWRLEDAELQHLTSHYAESTVTDSHIARAIRETERGAPERMKYRRDEIFWSRFYRSEAGLELFRLTANVHQPRLTTNIYWRPMGGQGWQSVMPEIPVVPESNGDPPHVLWGVTVDAAGNLVEWHKEHATGSRRVRPGEVIYHPGPLPEGYRGWNRLGPDTPLPPLQPVSEVDTVPPPPDEPKDDDPTDLTDPDDHLRPLPRWRVERWLQARGVPVHLISPLAEIVWQAQRLEAGEDQAEERLIQAVRELRGVREL